MPAPRWHLPLLLIVAALVYLPSLSAHGFRSTEGHRAIPGFELRATGEVLPTRMFEQAYLRKPPGMPWAIAISDALLNTVGIDNPELAARLPSAAAAIAMALVAYWFARLWTGPRWALAAGLAQALFPRMWMTGRAAEIEAPHNLFVQLAALALVQACLVLVTKRARAMLPWAVLSGIGLFGAFLFKGPAGWMVPALVALAAAITLRRAIVLLPLAVALAIGGALSGALVWLIAQTLGEEPAITQSPEAFLFAYDQLGKVAAMPATALAGALPLSILLVFPFRAKAFEEAGGSRSGDRTTLAPTFLSARILAVGFLLALAVMTAIGVINPRYTDPALVLLAPIAAYALWGWSGGFTADRRAWTRAFGLGYPAVWPAVLAIGAVVWIVHFERERGEDSGREPGLALSASIPDGATVWAEGMVEARPETLWYAAQGFGRGRNVGVLWKKDEIAALELPEAGGYLLLRDDELAAYQAAYEGAGVAIEVITTGAVHEYGFALVRVAAGG